MGEFSGLETYREVQFGHNTPLRRDTTENSRIALWGFHWFVGERHEGEDGSVRFRIWPESRSKRNDPPQEVTIKPGKKGVSKQSSK